MNLNRHFKHAKKRAQHVAQHKMEMLAAAFLKETGLQASEARLCQSTRMTETGDAVIDFYFERADSKADLANAHHDVRFMFDVLYGFNEVAKRGPVSDADLAPFKEMVSDFMEKYADEAVSASSPLPVEKEIAAATTEDQPPHQLADGVPS